MAKCKALSMMSVARVNMLQRSIKNGQKQQKCVVYLAGKVDKEMIDPVQCSDACWNRLVQHLPRENRDNG